jgi:hypothetical protein
MRRLIEMNRIKRSSWLLTSALLGACTAHFQVKHPPGSNPPVNPQSQEEAEWTETDPKDPPADLEPSPNSEMAATASQTPAPIAAHYRMADFALNYERFEEIILRKDLSRDFFQQTLPGTPPTTLRNGTLKIVSRILKGPYTCSVYRYTQDAINQRKGQPNTNFYGLRDPSQCAPLLLAQKLQKLLTNDTGGQVIACPAVRAPLLPPMLLTKDKIVAARYGFAQLNPDCTCTQTSWDGNPDGKLGIDAGWREILGCSRYQLAELFRVARPTQDYLIDDAYDQLAAQLKN